MTSVALVYSLGDIAGRGVADRISSMTTWRSCSVGWSGAVCRLLADYDVPMVGFREDVLSFNFLDRILDADAYIVLSRHSSASGEPTLSLHHPGNPTSRAEHGGRPRELAWSYPSMAKTLLMEYHAAAAEHGLLDTYKFTLEATHHGPTELSRPIVFIEIGSREEQWRDPRAQEAMAQAVLAALEKGPSNCTPVVGVGGTHYPDKHTRLMLETDYCYGHIFAKYVLGEIDEEILLQAVRKSIDPIRRIVVLKVPSRARRIAEKVAESTGLEIDLHK